MTRAEAVFMAAAIAVGTLFAPALLAGASWVLAGWLAVAGVI
jgi:hypothetical protein